jgi:molybdopterin-guanine dinucleotide biosynthesis protein A
MPHLTAAILAGGRASRLGGIDKGALVLGGTSIVQRQIRLLRPLAERLVIVANDRGRYANLGVPVIRDLVADKGPLGGLYTALVDASAEWTMVVACDLPFLDAGFLRHLVASARDVEAVVPRTADGLHPLCAVYAASTAPAARRLIESGRLKVLDLLAAIRVREIAPDEVEGFDPDGLLLFNLNTPEDYRRAIEHARTRRGP